MKKSEKLSLLKSRYPNVYHVVEMDIPHLVNDVEHAYMYEIGLYNRIIRNNITNQYDANKLFID